MTDYVTTAHLRALEGRVRPVNEAKENDEHKTG